MTSYSIPEMLTPAFSLGLIIYVVGVAISHSKRVEIGLKGIEMS